MNCPHCGKPIIASNSLAAKVLAAVGGGESSTTWIKAQMPAGVPDKEIYNALSYLKRVGAIERPRYGYYRLALNKNG